jgi:NACHT domain
MSNTNLVRPSRDGDQFHYLWAARRCLKLLSSEGGPVAISIEGPSPQENVGASIIEAGEEVIDIGEYFGSEDISTALLVRYMQLKHSTLHATKPWTASGIEKTINGFAKRYKDLLKVHSVDVLASKLAFWFVTNRPIGADLLEAVADAASGKTSRHPKELEKLKKFTGLDGDALIKFLTLMHFEGRQDDHWNQRNILVQEVSGYLPNIDVDGPLRLKELVTRRALSEGEVNPTITKLDVLRALNTDESLLFPATCLIKDLNATVLRAQETELMNAIVGSRAPIVIHASAGVGKTVFATRIASGLPEGSKCILYDCFGNGLYRNSSGFRHRHKDALVQIANELASMGLCHLLIPTMNADASAYMRAFAHRINQAATSVTLVNPNALLCVVMDAADNAQMAAEEVGETQSFVRDLIRERMPDNVRLVFTCRSHRQSHLDPPVHATIRELRPFSREETAVYLQQTFPSAGKHDIDEFHRLSSQNPRVQALALSRNDTLSDTLRLLGPNPTTVEDTIGNLLEGAIVKLKDSVGPVERTQVDKICAGLAALRPLIPISILSEISGVEQEAIKSFAIDLGRPLLVAGNTIQFFDEPAESWFRERFKPTTEAMVLFIASLTPLAAKSAYVSSVLPQLMLEAGKFTELVDLALTSKALPEVSPFERRDVELQRLQFALKAGLRSKRYLDSAKLALKAGGETAGDDRQRKILQANTDLATVFLEANLIQEIVSRRTFGSGWLGSHHAYEAGLLSGRSELVGEARSRLRMANEWLRNWGRLTPNERKKEKIADQDIVELTLAHINIHGAEDGARNLGRWTPREVSFRVGRTVTRRLIDHGRFQDVEKFAYAAGNNICLVLAVCVELREIQRLLPIEVTKRTFWLISNTRVKLTDGQAWDDRDGALTAVTSLVEASLQQNLCSFDHAAALLSRYLPSEPPRGLSSRFSKSRFPVLRAYCLRASLQGKILELGDLAHAELRAEMEKKNQRSTSRDLQEFQEDIGALLPWHQLWAEALLGLATRDSLGNKLSETRRISSSAAKVYHRDDFHTSNEIALLWLDILHELDAVTPPNLAEFLKWKEGLNRPLFTPTLTALARLSGQKELTKANALEFALEAFNLTKNERSDAEIKSDGYVAAARAILSVSKADAHEYFNEAVKVASKIGDENLSRWDSILDLADRCYRTNRPAPELAYQFARCAELTYDYVVRDKHFDWYATVEALCGLCPSSTMAILSRWRDRHFGWTDRILPVAINRLVELGALDARDVIPLVSFPAEWSYERLLETSLSKCGTNQEKSAVVAYLYRYMRFSGGSVSSLKKVLSRHRVSNVDIDEAITNEEAKRDSSGKLDHGSASGIYADSESTQDWDEIFETVNVSTAEGLSQCYANLKNSGPPYSHDEFFKECFRRVPVGVETGLIEAFGNTPEFDLYHFRNFLEQLPEPWKDRPAIKRALEKTLKVFCRRYCMGITKNRHYEALPLKLACELAGIDEGDVVGVVLDAVGETSNLADSGRLFSLVGLLATKLTEDEALDALKFGLDLFSPTLEDKDGDGQWSHNLLPPTDPLASLAGYIWAALAAPEATLRWEGAHAVRGLVELGRQDVLNHLMQLATTIGAGPFGDAKFVFYQLHAVQWLLIGIARAAIDFPKALAPWANQIVDWALKEQPHVMIRQFAARAGLALIEGGVLEDKDHLRSRLSAVNKSPFPIIDSKSYDRVNKRLGLGPALGDNDKFYFGIDIGPYWYAPLGAIFALSQDEIEAEAIEVIRNDFKSIATGRWDEDERSKRKLYEENHSSHSHGSYPRIDTLHFYHAYHAMMIVAGKLLKTRQTHRSPDWGEEDEFLEWIRRHDLSRQDNRWLWDRRDPRPFERPSWMGREKNEIQYRKASTHDCDEALKSSGMLNVRGYWTGADSDRQQSVHISSALVVPHKARALLNALSTEKSSQDYALPTAGSDFEIEKAGFVLEGWISDQSRDRDLDGLDRWAGNISFPPPTPAKRIKQLMGITTDADERVWRDKDQSAVLVSQVWGHYDEARRHEISNPERGRRLQASQSWLTSMLAQLDRQLIIEVKVDRRLKYKPYGSSIEDGKEEKSESVKIYLLKADGQIETF